MSAAAPLPPPGPPRPNVMNGYPNGPQRASADGYRGSDGAGDGRGSGGAFPPIAQIAASATNKARELEDGQVPIQSLMTLGRKHLQGAKTALDRRGDGPAAAYWDYLVAYEIVVNSMPRHPDYYDRITTSRSHMHREYNELLKDIRSSEERFKRIKDIIINDNKRNGVQQAPAQSSRPSSASSQYSNRTEGSHFQASRLSNVSVLRRDDELMLPDVPSQPPVGRASVAAPPEPQKKKPEVHPKPQSLHGRALYQSSTSTVGSSDSNDLADRFARLRGTAAPISTTSSSSGMDSLVKMPSPSEYQSSRPVGPRDMPPPPSHAPMHPPKLPLNTQLAASLPKEPSPTYSPARNLSQPASVNPPRSTARSIVGTGGRSNSMQASSASAFPPHTNGDTGSYFPPQSNGQMPPPARRRSSVTKQTEEQIHVEKFFDYLKMYNVLVIDVRSREEFDAGHIYTRSIICIEPTALQDGYSAEQLQEALVLSPDEEQAMFERRNEYDLVVYHDESTETSSFLNKHNRNEKELALRRLYDTLHNFNAEKPLKQPPIFLKGGIDSWTDMLGPHGLKMSTTASIVASGQTRSSRGIRRTPAASHAAKLTLQKRRMREYVPMDPEEERKWLEEARKGRPVFEQGVEDEYDEDTSSPMYRTTEEFLRRFPDIEAEQQSMMYPPARPPPLPQHAPPPIPQAPSRPAPSVPRVSYSGVHERQIATQGRGAELPVYIPPGRYGQIRLHRTGLINFGVTCYMNSVLQCLCGNNELSSIFLSRHYQKDIQRDNWKSTKGILSEAFETLVSNLFKGDASAVRPTTFRRVCGHFNSQWEIDQQQDAKEFLEFFLDHLHEDLNVTWNRSPLKTLTEAEEKWRESLPRPFAARIEWNRYQHRDRSLIGNLFAGQHASRLTCTTCGTTSTTYEAFWSISVEIPRDRPADIRDCLRSYCSAERLEGDDIWKCPRCKRDREAMKKITITRAPDSLVVHFKRFSASHNERARKVQTPIHFPLQGLDLGPFMEPPITPEQEAHLMTNAKDGPAQLTALRTDPAMNGPFIYNAYAVIWHIGNTLGSGHYIAHVKDKSRGCWRRFNDNVINDFEPGNLPQSERLQNEKAYIVFYERERVAGGML